MAREVSTWHGKRKRWECEMCGVTYEAEGAADRCCAGKDRVVETATLDEWRQFTEGGAPLPSEMQQRRNSAIFAAPEAIRRPDLDPATPVIPDHALAAAEALEAAAKAIRAGESVEDIAGGLLRTVRIMARRT